MNGGQLTIDYNLKSQNTILLLQIINYEWNDYVIFRLYSKAHCIILQWTENAYQQMQYYQLPMQMINCHIKLLLL